MTLTADRRDRYARHLWRNEIGCGCKGILLESHVAIIGAGGSGNPAIQDLAAAGVGKLTVIDHDAVDLSNLQRQVLFATADIGRSKADAAREAVARLTPDVPVAPIHQRITADNAEAILSGADVVLGGCDNFPPRLAVDASGTRLQIPLLSTATGQYYS